MSMSVDGAFIYFTIPIFGGIPITQTTVSHLIVTIFLCTVCIVLGKRLTKRPNGVQVMVEKGVMMVRNMVVETMGEHNPLDTLRCDDFPQLHLWLFYWLDRLPALFHCGFKLHTGVGTDGNGNYLVSQHQK